MSNILSLENFDNALAQKNWDLKKLADKYDKKYSSEGGRTIYNTLRKWRSPDGNPTLSNLARICDLLECDVDYLLGRIKETNHTVKFIHEETGLSEVSQKVLHEIIQTPYLGELRLEIINHLIEDPAFSLALIDSINKCYEKYTRFKQGSIMYAEEKKEIDKLTQNNILEELRLKEAGKLPCKITREQLLERQDSYDASLMNVQRRFNDIIIDLIKEYYEKHYSNNL